MNIFLNYNGYYNFLLHLNYNDYYIFCSFLITRIITIFCFHNFLNTINFILLILGTVIFTFTKSLPALSGRMLEFPAHGVRVNGG